MEAFSALLVLCAGNSPVPGTSPLKGQWRGALMFSFICAWINDWVYQRSWWFETPSWLLWRQCNGRNKLPKIYFADDILKVIFVWNLILIKNSLEIFANDQLTVVQHCSNNGLAPYRRQAIIWSNDVIVYWRIYALLGLSELYSETTWAGGIAQSTHHEVRSGGQKFCPHRGPSWELIAQYRPPCHFAFIPHLIRAIICIFF